MTRTLATVVTCLLGLGCSTPSCPEGQTAGADGACVADTDDTDGTVDSGDTDVPVPTRRSLVRLEWDIDVLPTDNVVELTCDGQAVFAPVSTFTVYRTYSEENELPAGQSCVVRISDRRGGQLAGGRAIVCSQEVLTWEPRRGKVFESEPFDTYGCVPGCADPVAENYDATTNLDDGSCIYVRGCTNPEAENFDPLATKDDGSCDLGGFGLVEVVLQTDDHPEDNAIRVMCNGSQALRVDGADEGWLKNAIVRLPITLDAGLTCEVVLEERVGDKGPGGRVVFCGEEAASWLELTGDGRDVEVAVATFDVVACSGCTDPTSPAYDPEAVVEDGS
ncbi:MAG: hypothetical protein KC656_21745, partial [Myxococcales bacterium]|nr:hypothetical protein [Myxococcales bacterium]